MVTLEAGKAVGGMNVEASRGLCAFEAGADWIVVGVSTEGSWASVTQSVQVASVMVDEISYKLLNAMADVAD